MNNFKFLISFLSLFSLIAISCTSSTAQKTSTNSQFEIAPEEYAVLTAEAVDHVEHFAWSKFYGMLSEDVEYYLPDGGPETRTSLIGKKAVMEFWNAYEEKSGNTKIVMSDEVHLPVISKKELAYTNIAGVMVISYFTLDMEYGKEKVSIRMNWGVHFNADKKIDRIYTYYDRTPIIEAAKRNFLSQGK